jgi:hypothetical protein
MGAQISLSDCLLVLRGWCEAKRRVRAVLKDSPVSFAVCGTIYGVNEHGFSVSIDDLNMVAAWLEGCTCGFIDLPAGEEVLGIPIESSLLAVRKDFNLVVMLLVDK